ncbi:hypothetical protein [Nitrososphaera sp. AFS]|uniref:hypothetical protein n=1 Tax=Nitrososphaera sp. AFS TaxID=2301191 RepID=UPI0013923A01|nr:hypothetical protein [Nitrososphaera sp. AFS]NAL78180.1 hypothetical protein [Nitrososphaera sp. AFS]
MSFKASRFSLEAPSDLSFHTFFDLVDNTTRNSILRQLPTAPVALYLYSSKDQTTTCYSLTVVDGGSITDALIQLTVENPHDFYTMTAETSGEQAESLLWYQYGNVSELGVGEMKDNLIVGGFDGKFRTIIYDIIRARAGDDSSQVLRFEKVDDSDDWVFLKNTEY